MRTTLAALGMSLVLVAGCGGNDGDSEGADEFRAQVDALCVEYLPKVAVLPPPLENEEWAALGGDIGDLLETMVNELRLLDPPDGLGEGYDDWVGLRSEGLAAVRDLQTAGGLHDDAGVDEALGRVAEIHAEADALADELGLTECESSALEPAGNGR